MKKILLLIAITVCSIQLTNAQKKTYALKVTITNLSSNEGTILFGVYKNKATFLKKTFKSDVLKIENNTATVVVKNLPEGEYAVSYVHDENDNKKMDTNFIGIPSEDYGCSNNATGFMGPPKYEDAKFLLKENKTITIKN